VPNSNIIIIKHPERFGLSQLHQLRGRVGRGEHQSFCVLVYPDNVSEESLNRINILTTTDDGFEISEKDLSLRGAGDILGSRQHGYSDNLQFADIIADIDLLIKAREDAIEILTDQKLFNEYSVNIQKFTDIKENKILHFLS